MGVLRFFLSVKFATSLFALLARGLDHVTLLFIDVKMWHVKQKFRIQSFPDHFE